METETIVNLLGVANMNLQNLQQENYMLSMIKITDYGEGNEDSATVKFETKVIKSNLCDNFQTHIFL